MSSTKILVRSHFSVLILHSSLWGAHDILIQPSLRKSCPALPYTISRILSLPFCLQEAYTQLLHGSRWVSFTFLTYWMALTSWKLCCVNLSAMRRRSLHEWVSAKARIPKQLDGCSCCFRNSQQTSWISCIWSKQAEERKWNERQFVNMIIYYAHTFLKCFIYSE